MPKNRYPGLTFEFKDNKLIICRHNDLAYEISVWPKPHAEALNAVGCWQHFYPEFRLIDYPYRGPKKKASTQLELGMEIPPLGRVLSKEDAYEQLRQSMPFAYAIALAPFQSHQWNLIILLSMKHRFYDLIKSNAVLAYMLANSPHIMTQIFRKQLMMDTLTGMKQPELFKLMGFPETRQFAQIVRKIKPASASPSIRNVLLHCLYDEQTIKKLSHLKKINTGVLTLLTRNEEIRNMLTPQLLEEVSEVRAEDHYPATAHRLTESLQWHRELRGRAPFPAFRSLQDINAYYDEIVHEGEQVLAVHEQREQAEYDARRREDNRRYALEEALRQQFSDPPVQGTDEIVPLRNTRELIAEGRKQRNCVGNYSDRVKAGTCYIYKVLAPERATLSIVKDSGGRWMVSELLAICNKPVAVQTRDFIEEWLSQACVGI